jgi:hypothetical protein
VLQPVRPLAAARFEIALKAPPLPVGYIAAVLLGALLLEFLPYVEELARGLRAIRKFGFGWSHGEDWARRVTRLRGRRKTAPRADGAAVTLEL